MTRHAVEISSSALRGHPEILTRALALFGLQPQSAPSGGVEPLPPPETQRYVGDMSPAAMLALARGCLKLVGLPGKASLVKPGPGVER